MKIDFLGESVSQWGETPFFEKGFLYWIDAKLNRFWWRNWETGQEAFVELPFSPGCVVSGEIQNVFFAAGEGGFFRLILDKDKREVEVLNLGNPLPEGLRFNDGKCAPDGYFFAGSIDPNREPSGGVWRIDSSGKIKQIFGPVCNSNGLVWFEDKVFHIDTTKREIACFDYANGEWSNRRVAFETLPEWGSPDGMAIDAEGCLWIAFCHGGRVRRFDQNGKVLEMYKFPCIETTACCFAGKNLTDLVITTGVSSRINELYAGRLFCLNNLGVVGTEFYSLKG